MNQHKNSQAGGFDYKGHTTKLGEKLTWSKSNGITSCILEGISKSIYFESSCITDIFQFSLKIIYCFSTYHKTYK